VGTTYLSRRFGWAIDGEAEMTEATFVNDDDQTLSLIQHEIGDALRLSYASMTCEPLSMQIVLLLLRLALAETLRASVEQEIDVTDQRPLCTPPEEATTDFSEAAKLA
jgi:hypothetical protein